MYVAIPYRARKGKAEYSKVFPQYPIDHYCNASMCKTKVYTWSSYSFFSAPPSGINWPPCCPFCCSYVRWRQNKVRHRPETWPGPGLGALQDFYTRRRGENLFNRPLSLHFLVPLALTASVDPSPLVRHITSAARVRICRSFWPHSVLLFVSTRDGYDDSYMRHTLLSEPTFASETDVQSNP